MNFVRTEQSGKIGKIIIDRPKALNALNQEVLGELKEAVATLKEKSVVILTGAGERAFVAGADIAAMVEMTGEQAKKFAEQGQNVMRAIEEAPFVTIAAVNGFALGGGLELAMSCDLIYASTNAKLGLPETNLGIIPGFGGTLNLLPRVGFHRALEMVLTGKMISAAEAKDLGLVLEVFEPTELISKVQEIAEKLAKKGKHSLQATRALLRAVSSPLRDEAYEAERETFSELFKTREPREGMKAFLEKREPKFD